jgi:hypothetical protein
MEKREIQIKKLCALGVLCVRVFLWFFPYCCTYVVSVRFVHYGFEVARSVSHVLLKSNMLKYNKKI